MNNNKKDNFNVLFTKIIVVGAIALLVLVIVLLSIGIAAGKKKNPLPADTTGKPVDTTSAPETAAQPDTSNATETSGSPETVNQPETTSSPESTSSPVTTNAPETTKKPPETTPAPSDAEHPNSIVNWQKFESSSAYLARTEDAGKEYQDRIIFLGDSTTNGLRAYGVLSDGINTKQVWTGTSGTLTLDNTIMNKTIYYPDMGKEVTIIEAVKDKKPEILIITLGVNGISFSNEEQFTTNYTNLVLGIKDASPKTKIILQSIFPVTAKYDADETKRIKNEKIRAANEWILGIAEKYGFRFLNTTSVLQGANGALIDRYCNDAELHLNEIGLQKELTYIRTHAYQ